MRLRHLALPAAAGLALLAVPFAPVAQAAAAPTCGGGSCTVTYATTGAPESFTVPAGVTELVVGLFGGSGGTGHPQNGTGPTNPGGNGGAVVVRVPVTPGETLTVVVGGKGADWNTDDTTAGPGGYGGGGDASAVFGGTDGAGGGGSFLFRGAAVVAAVGGGGGGGFDAGGDGGAGGPGSAGAAGSSDLSGGGASTTAPGAAGAGDGGQAGTGPASGPATFGTGGEGQPVDDERTCPAGGGGGGYYGGGAGGCRFDVAAPSLAADDPTLADYGSGGGGSGFLATGVTTLASGTHVGDGNVAIGYAPAAAVAATTTTLVTDDTTLAPGQEADLTATVTGPSVTAASADVAADVAAVAAKLEGNDAALAARAVAAPAAAAPAAVPASTPSTACGASPCTVTFLVNGTPLGDPIALDPATGTATVVFTAGSDLGVRQIVARYDGNALYAASTSAAVAITVSGLADTGPGDVAPMLGASAALLALGAGLVVGGRRRPPVGAHRAA